MKERYVIPSPGNSLENNIKSVPLNIWNGPCFSNNFTVKWVLLIFAVLFWILSQISNILMPNAAYSHNSLLAPSSFPYSAWHLIVLQHCFGGPWYNVLHYSIQMSILLVQLMYLSSGISCLSFCWIKHHSIQMKQTTKESRPLHLQSLRYRSRNLILMYFWMKLLL